MNIDDGRCPLCEEGMLHERVEYEETEYNGHKGMTPLCFSVCDACGSEVADAEQTRRNKRAMITFRKRVDGLLTGAEVRALRERLGLSQSQAAKIFGGGPVAFSKYENDDVSQSDAMDRLLRVAADVPGALALLAAHADIELPDTRAAVDGWLPAEGWRPERESHMKPAARVVPLRAPEGQQRRYGT